MASKTDAQLKRDVLAELHFDAAVGAIQVGVRVRDGVAMLTGCLPDVSKIDAIERAVRRVAGVKAIAMEFDFEPESLPSEWGAVTAAARAEAASRSRAAS